MVARYLRYRLAKADGDQPRPAHPDDAINKHPIVSGEQNTGMISAENPRFPVITKGGHKSLAQHLSQSGLHFEETEGKYGDEEPSFIVYNPSREQMHSLGRAYGQEAVVFNERGGKREMLYTNGEHDGKAHPGIGYAYHPHHPPPDYYTRIPGAGFLCLHFDGDKLVDTPIRHSLHAAQQVQSPVVTKREYSIGDLRKAIAERLTKSQNLVAAHPNAYAWHDPHTDHHFKVVAPGGVLIFGSKLAKADELQAHPHMDGSKPPEAQPKNEQAAPVGVSTYAKFAAPFGKIIKGTPGPTTIYPYHGKLPEVERTVKDHGYSVYYAGGKYGRPDLSSRNYNTKHLMVYDPSPDSGASFGAEDYTKAWRQVHELSHALTYPTLNETHGEGRRIGKLGIHRSLGEALRAVHWEWLAVHKQRELSAQLGVHIPDDQFHQELNTVMHDAAHRAVTGQFTEPSGEGFHPHSHKVPLETSLGLVREAAHNMGLHGLHGLLNKSEPSTNKRLNLSLEERRASVANTKTYNIPEVRERLAKAIKVRVDAYSEELQQLRVRELRKSDEDCLLCGEGLSCSCLKKSAAPAIEKCGETMLAKKSELCPNCSNKDCKCPGVAASDKAPKDVTPKKSGHGGIPGRGKKLGKADVPMAPAPTKAPTSGPPKSTGGSPKIGGAPAGPPKLGKSESRIPGLRKSLPSPAALEAKPAPVPNIPHQVDFTSASANQPNPKGAAVGEMKPAGAPKTINLKIHADGSGAKAAVTKLNAALKGAKAPVPAIKSETTETDLKKSLGDCVLCGKPEHVSVCAK